MRKKVSISDLVLLALEKTVDGYVRFDDFVNNPGFYGRGGGWDYPLKKASIAVALKRLREQGFIDLDDYNNRLTLKLTDQGKSEAILRKVLRDETWDGKWRIAIFDIPEKHRKARNILRSKLKTWGFVPWQKSVWASKKNITDILRGFIKQVGIEKWVMVVESENTGKHTF